MVSFRYCVLFIWVLFHLASVYAGHLVSGNGYIYEKSHAVEAIISNQIAFTKVTQVFVSNQINDEEAMYDFRLPHGARIYSLVLWIKGSRMNGAIVEKRRGREIYETITKKKIDPALLEDMGDDNYRIRVYPVIPNQEQRVELAYWQLLPYEGGNLTYGYPCRIDKWGRPTSCTDFSFSVKVTSPHPIVKVSSPNSDMSIDNKGRHESVLSLHEPRFNYDYDVSVACNIQNEKNSVDVECYRPDPNQDGYFMVKFTPDTRYFGNAITFLLDISGSMFGKKLENAKLFLSRCINSLKPDDCFNILLFETSAKFFRQEFLEASEQNKKEALDFIQKASPSHDTDLYNALQAVANNPMPGKYHRIVILSDGVVTAGKNEAEILPRSLIPGTRIFTVCFDDREYPTNQTLLKRLATESEGGFFQSSEFEPFLQAINNRVCKIEIDFESVAGLHDILPKAPYSVLDMSQLVVAGRYKEEGTFPLHFTIRIGREEIYVEKKMVFPKQDENTPFIANLWATRKIERLVALAKKWEQYYEREKIDEMITQSSMELPAGIQDRIKNRIKDRKEIHGEEIWEVLVQYIVQLSKTLGIVTPYTSYLVLENEKAYHDWNLEPKIPALPIPVRISTKTGNYDVSASKARNYDRRSEYMTLCPPSEIDIKEAIRNLKQLRDRLYILALLEDWRELGTQMREIRYERDISYLSSNLLTWSKKDSLMDKEISQMRRELQEWKRSIQEDMERQILKTAVEILLDAGVDGIKEWYEKGHEVGNEKMLYELARFIQDMLVLLKLNSYRKNPQALSAAQMLETLHEKTLTNARMLESWRKMKLQGIIYSRQNPEDSRAFINEKPYRKGDVVFGFTVSGIEENGVILRYKEETLLLQLLSRGIIKKPIKSDRTYEESDKIDQKSGKSDITGEFIQWKEKFQEQMERKIARVKLDYKLEEDELTVERESQEDCARLLVLRDYRDIGEKIHSSEVLQQLIEECERLSSRLQSLPTLIVKAKQRIAIANALRQLDEFKTETILRKKRLIEREKR